MRWPRSTTRRQLVVEHPLAMGFVWGALTILVMAIFELTATHRVFDMRWIGVHLIVFAIMSPAWGYMTRWAILRRQQRAR